MANTEKKYSQYYIYIQQVIKNKYVKSFAPYIFSVLSIIIFTIFAIRPTVITIIDLQKSIQDNQKVLDLLEQKSIDLTNGKKNLDSIDPNIKDKINTRLPLYPAVTNLISNLQISATNTASISGIQVQPITIYNTVVNTKSALSLDEIIFSFNNQGSYNQLITILDNVTKSSRLINLTSAIFSKTTDGISLSISGKGYYLKQ